MAAHFSKKKGKHHYCDGIPNYKPKICTDGWTFYEDCPSTEWKRRTAKIGPYEREWREKYDTRTSPYKDIVKANLCLPKVRTGITQKTGKKNHIYTRYTQEQHRRMDNVSKIEEIIKMRCASDRQLTFSEEKKEPKWKSLGLEKLTRNLIEEASAGKAYAERSLAASAHNSEVAEVAHSGSNTSANLKAEDGKKDKGAATNTTTVDLEATLDMKLKNPYKSFAKPPRMTRDEKAKAAKKKKAKKAEEEEDENAEETIGLISATEIKLNEAVMEFCDKMADLGGEDGQLDPLIINCLFTSGWVPITLLACGYIIASPKQQNLLPRKYFYDTTPCMPAPVSLVKSADLPPALREGHGGFQNTQSRTNGAVSLTDTSSGKSAFEKHMKADRNAYRYGAWYLKPKKWTRVRRDVKLQDPGSLQWEATLTDLDMKKREVTEQLSTLQITKTFAEFINSRRGRLPEFIEEAEKFVQEREEKERQKIESEAKAKQEFLSSKNK